MTEQPDPWGLDQRKKTLLERAAKAALRQLSLGRAQSYRAMFLHGRGSPRDREIVLADLRDFASFERKGVFSADALEMARRAGRQEVWLRIANHLSLTDDQVRRLQPLEIDDGL